MLADCQEGAVSIGIVCEQSEIGNLKVDDIIEAIRSNTSAFCEVVFHHKAAMWDSPESVWMVAAQDSQCHEYVISIPYFDRELDGSFGDIHYEAKLYPDYVPITHWEEHYLKERHPDTIYTQSIQRV